MKNRSDPLILLFAIPILFLALAANSIWDANEAFYVETPRQMIASGDYVHPTFNGLPRLNKPVLSYWVVAGFYRAFGESVAVERVAIALGAVGILLATFLIGRALGGTGTGVLAALVFATAPRVVFFSRRIFIDVYITLFMSLALALFVMALRAPARRRLYLIGMYVAIGLGFLTKGPIALALPGLVILIWTIAERRTGEVRRLMLVPGALIVLAIAAPWWAALYAERGWDPIYRFFMGENVDRFLTPVTTSRSPFFFLPVLLADILLPWAPLLVVPLVSYWRRTPGPAATGPDGAIRRLLWWWIVAIVLFFSFAASKEDLYIYPVMPAAAALIAHALVTTGFGAAHQGVRIILAAIGAGCALLGGVVMWLFGSGYYRIDDAAAIASILAVVGVLVAVLTMRGRGRAAVSTLAGGFVVLNYLFVLHVLPGLERLKPVPELARVISARASPDAQVGFCNVVLPSFVFYLGRPITELDCLGGPAHPVQFFTQYPETWIVTSDSDWEALRPLLPGACVAARRPLFDLRLENILTGQKPPDVLLVTNKCR